MHLYGLTDWLRLSQAYQALLKTLRTQQGASLLILRAARPFLLACLAQDWQGSLIYLTAKGRRAYNVAEQLPVWMSDSARITRWADPTPMFYDRIAWDKAVIQERIAALGALSAPNPARPPIVIASARALMQRTLPPDILREATQEIAQSQRTTPEKLVAHWVSVGYEPSPIVLEQGTFSRRGGILDIFPMHASAPVRIEFFGDEVESLRAFDPTTQRTHTTLERVRILPAREVLPYLTPQASARIVRDLASITAQEGTRVNLAQDGDALLQGQAFAHLEHYLPYLYDTPATLLDHAPANTLILVEDSAELEASVEELEATAQTNRANNIATAQLAPDHPAPYVGWQTLAQTLGRARTLQLSNVPQHEGEKSVFSPARRFSGQLKNVLTHAQDELKAGHRVVVVSAQVDRLRALWEEQTNADFVPKHTEIAQLPTGITFVEGELSEGWQAETANTRLTLISDGEIFNWERPEPRRRQSEKRGRKQTPESDYADWKDGEYVVHVDYGIGKFNGLQSRLVEGHEREYIVVLYQDNDTVFVPIHQADRLSRYVGADDSTPALNNLSKPAEWQKAKERARKAAEDEARELLEIYAKRVSAQGYAYRPDTPYQHELEANFPFVETQDQLRVLAEVKADMEAAVPMDRLVCGDVGYGKTEVALRAAFKAVMDGKQVAVLVPTTVLADQHYHTFSRRMEGFGVVVELMSRFRTAREQSEVLTRLINGKVDILIGTHRILGEDVSFPNLGLLIIDEEQRFGVKHKEHFKKLRAQVDVLTLSATPIPRTLYMSLSGVRDISMIQTPPEERLPIVTHVGAFDDKLTRQAILRELDRGGQVFVIHNRIRTIEALRDKLEALVPEASIVIGHGQMGGRQLESVISEFGKGKYDVLLATSIIENGIDMPNVNTLIVDHAEWFGLSQLYQIRGRVGRGAQQAYAYFFHARGNMTEEARQRLETLAEYSDLGVGFQIAVRDLEIRGSGDILSMKQSGFVQTVGLQLYSQMLAQAVARQKQALGESTPAPVTVNEAKMLIDLPIAAYIPETWLPEMALRLQIYRRIGNLKHADEVQPLREELQDRFGTLPNAVEGLLYQIEVKLLGQAIQATSIGKPRDHLVIKLPWLSQVDRDGIAWRVGKDVEVSRVSVEVRVTPEKWRERLLSVLRALGEAFRRLDPTLISSGFGG